MSPDPLAETLPLIRDPIGKVLALVVILDLHTRDVVLAAESVASIEVGISRTTDPDKRVDTVEVTTTAMKVVIEAAIEVEVTEVASEVETEVASEAEVIEAVASEEAEAASEAEVMTMMSLYSTLSTNTPQFKLPSNS